MLTLPPPWQLRKMVLDDLTAVKEIDRLSFPTPAREGLFEHEVEGNTIAYYQVLEWVEGGQAVIIGFSGYWLIGDEMHISTIAVHPDWRGKKLGELLLLNMLTTCSKHPVTLITLEVRTSNQTAQNLYHKYQFQMVGQRRRYYRDTGEDALIMTLAALDAPYHQFLNQQQDSLLTRLPTISLPQQPTEN